MASRDDRPRLAIAGVFDIANYGDQLFPLIAAHRLDALGIDVAAVAPLAQHRLRPDAMRPHDLAWLMTTEEDVDAVLIGGGNILYNLRADYAAGAGMDPGRFGLGLHTGLWLGAAIAAALRDIPFGFNAPGLPYPFSARVAAEVLWPVLAAADIRAVRDRASAALAQAACAEVAVVPDTAAGIAAMWPRETLAPALHGLGWAGTPYAAIHLRAAPGDDALIRDAAACLDRFCARHGLAAVLVAIGDDLGDGQTARALQSVMTARAHVLDGSHTLRQVAATIAHARLYLGGSLHGYITAAAYGVPGLIVTGQPQRKFAGFLDWMDRPGDVATQWADACGDAADRLLAGAAPRIPPSVHAALDAHWTMVAGMVANPARRRGERAALLRRMAARAAGRDGMGWLLAPFAVPARDRAGAA